MKCSVGKKWLQSCVKLQQREKGLVERTASHSHDSHEQSDVGSK